MKLFPNIFKNRNFRRFFIANTIAYVGINIGLVGINWFVIDYTGKNQILATYMAISLISTFISSFFIGPLNDLYNKSSIMRICNAIQGVLLLVLVFLFLNKINILFIIYSLAIVTSICLAIYSTASRSIIQEILDQENLIYGNSVIEICIQIGSIVAACLTGIIYEAYGFALIILLMALSLFISALFMKKMKYNIEHEMKDNETYLRGISNGMKYLVNNKIILVFGMIIMIPNIVTLVSNSVLPGYVKEHLLKKSIVYGIADMLFGVGALSAGIFISSIVKRLKRESIQIIMFLLSICSLAFLVVNKLVMGLYILYFIFGLANSSLKVILNTYIMEVVPKNFYARALSFWSAMSCILQVIMVFAVCSLMDMTSVTYGYVVLATIMLLGLVGVNLTIKRNQKICSSDQVM